MEVFGEDRPAERTRKWISPEKERKAAFESFRRWSDKVVLFCHVTTRVKTDKHQGLLGIRSWPTLVIMDRNGNVLAKPASRDVDGFDKALKRAETTRRELKELSGKALLLRRIELGFAGEEEARKALKDPSLSDAEKRTVKGAIADAEFRRIVAGTTKDTATHIAAGKACEEMYRDRRIPRDRKQRANFYYYVMVRAQDRRDVTFFEEVLDVARREFGSENRYKSYLKAMEKRLKALKD